MRKFFLLLICLMIIRGNVFSQYLNYISPVSLKTGTLPDSVSFILTSADYNFFKSFGRKHVKCANSIQIIDADAPFPPRWFVATIYEPTTGGTGDIQINAEYQHNEITFWSSEIITNQDGTENPHGGYIICNKNLEKVNVFQGYNRNLDTHDFKIAENGDKIYFRPADTVVHITNFLNIKNDTTITLTYEIIEITDSNNRLQFSWNPLQYFSVNDMYAPYANAPALMANKKSFGWSHGNSVGWDFDGNILYSFKHIGIGKISRKDGHIIWRIDRNNPKINSLSDSVLVVLQHDFKAEKDVTGNIFYTVLSNGDSAIPQCLAYKFAVKNEGQKNFFVKVISKYQPREKIPNTTGGNFDLEPNGNFLFNYGMFESDSTSPRPLFDYFDAKNNSYATYSVEPYIMSYRIHKLDNWRPPRPQITIKDGWLYSDTQQPGDIWYKLSGENNKTATEVGVGEKFQPAEDGVYCVATQYGIGHSVSRALTFKK